MENLNSKINISRTIIQYAISKVGFLLKVYSEVPIYFIDENLMDYLYPPEKRKLLDEESINRILKKYKDIKREIPKEKAYESSKNEIDKFFKEVEEYRREYKNNFIALGLYKRHLTNNELGEIKNRTGKSISSRPTIFICPERIKNSSLEISKKLKNSQTRTFKIIFTKVLLHELAHGYMNGNSKPYSKEYYSIIEEGLANALAISNFSENEEKAIVYEFVKNQPFEYRTCMFWLNEPIKYEIDEIAYIWRNNWIANYIPIPRDIAPYVIRYYIRRRYIERPYLPPYFPFKLTFEIILGILEFYNLPIHEEAIYEMIENAYLNDDNEFFWKILAFRIISNQKIF